MWRRHRTNDGSVKHLQCVDIHIHNSLSASSSGRRRARGGEHPPRRRGPASASGVNRLAPTDHASSQQHTALQDRRSSSQAPVILICTRKWERRIGKAKASKAWRGAQEEHKRKKKSFSVRLRLSAIFSLSYSPSTIHHATNKASMAKPVAAPPL